MTSALALFMSAATLFLSTAAVGYVRRHQRRRTRSCRRLNGYAITRAPAVRSTGNYRIR